MLDSIKLILISTQVEVGFELCNSSLHSLSNFILLNSQEEQRNSQGVGWVGDEAEKDARKAERNHMQ